MQQLNLNKLKMEDQTDPNCRWIQYGGYFNMFNAKRRHKLKKWESQLKVDDLPFFRSICDEDLLFFNNLNWSPVSVNYLLARS